MQNKLSINFIELLIDSLLFFVNVSDWRPNLPQNCLVFVWYQYIDLTFHS